MLVLKSSLGQINGEHTGYPHEPCHTSIDEFGCDTTPWEGRRPRVKEGGWLQRAYTVRTGEEWGEEGRRAGTERSKVGMRLKGPQPHRVQDLLLSLPPSPQQPRWLPCVPPSPGPAPETGEGPGARRAWLLPSGALHSPGRSTLP